MMIQAFLKANLVMLTPICKLKPNLPFHLLYNSQNISQFLKHYGRGNMLDF